jgi:hypothetical protein
MINKHFGIVKNGVINWESPNFRKEHIKLLEGVGIVETIKKRYKSISNPQYAYLFGQVYPLIQEWLDENWGEKFTITDIDLWLKGLFWFREVKGIKFPRSKTEMTTKEASEYLENVKNYVAEHMGIVIPEPI